MVFIDLNSFTLAIGALVPTIVIAIFVERHYTAFWTAVWNAFALILTGGSALLLPVTRGPLQIQIETSFFPLWAVLILYGLIVLILGLKIDDGIIRLFASSSLTASILLMAIIAQYFMVTNVILLLLMVGIFCLTLEVLKMKFAP